MRNNTGWMVILAVMLALAGGWGVLPTVVDVASARERPAASPSEGAESTQGRPDTGQGQRPSDGETPSTEKPAAPFKPSEEIRVDQAVDFPYDI